MKKFLIIFILLLSISMLTACQNPIVYERKPCNQSNTKWVSEDNSISFLVNNNLTATGEMTIKGNKVEFYLVNDMGSGVYLYSLNVLEANIETPEEKYEYWLCSFVSKKKFIATVQETTYFEVGQKITFYRVDQ